MKLKSLVTVNYYVTANYCNNFAHTAHHIQRVFILKRVNFSFLNVERWEFIGILPVCKHKKKEKTRLLWR